MDPRIPRSAGTRARRLCASLLFPMASSLALLAAPFAARAVSLAALFTGATVVADDKLFYDWTLLNLVTTNGGQADLTAIDVTPLSGDPLDPGVHFDAPVGALGTPFGHTGGSSVLLEFSFDVQATSQLQLIKDNSLLLTDWVFDSGPQASISVSEEVHDVTGAPLGSKHTIALPGEFPGIPNPNHFDVATFAPHQLVHVVKHIEILGPGDNDGAFLTGFEQRFSQTPEPGSLALVGLGVATLAGHARVRRRAASR